MSLDFSEKFNYKAIFAHLLAYTVETMDLTGKVAAVTGGTRGIGRALAESLLRGGARVFVAGRDAENLRLALAALREMGEADILALT